MTSETVLVPGARDVRGTLDVAGGTEGERDADSQSAGGVVACPPHPQFGGNRRDRRLRAVCEALNEVGIDCLRFDYGDWDNGYGEREDVRNAVRWARERYDRVGLFGYSFGGAMAILAAADVDVRAVSALA
ncbi:MAG: alpha/beta superfamily hydrolase, partial [Halobacteriales archaeon]